MLAKYGEKMARNLQRLGRVEFVAAFLVVNVREEEDQELISIVLTKL